MQHPDRYAQLFKQIKNKSNNESYRLVSQQHKVGTQGNPKKSFGRDKKFKKQTPGHTNIESKGEKEELKEITNCTPFTFEFISTPSICPVTLYFFPILMK